MPSHGSLVLSDFTAHYLTARPRPCGLRGHLNSLIDKRCDTKLTADHALTLANRGMAGAFHLYDRCRAHYGLCA